MPRSKRWDKRWDSLTREKQDLYVTLLWQDGYTEQAIADFLRATKGTIVRRRNTGLNLSSEGRGAVKRTVVYERFVDLLDLHKIRETEEKSNGKVTAIAPIDQPREREDEGEQTTSQAAYDEQRTASRTKPKYQLTANWQLQCKHRDERGHQCSFIKEPGSDYCKKHQ
ncbi:MAG: hypothetical protein P4L81_05045 [Candidatus Pacebacteria bacterium]|nr:hypothetical protein [Candidatus Paceibacterota bacterium]